MAAVAGTLAVVPVIGASCGDDSLSDAPLPPIVTTTSTTISLVTTTVVRQYYEVKPGDRLGNIADLLGVDMNELMALNGITNPNIIEVGQALLIPPATILIETLPTG
jgi:LysM repeat protein